MAKYLDREALVEWLKRIPIIDLSDGRRLCRVIMEDDFKKAIKKMPKGIIVDVAPVRHGRWIYHPDDLFPGDSTQECSLCHEEEYLTLYNENYCPNCGARMDEVK